MNLMDQWCLELSKRMARHGRKRQKVSCEHKRMVIGFLGRHCHHTGGSKILWLLYTNSANYLVSFLYSEGCAWCGRSLKGVVPFSKFEFKYCSTACVHRHRDDMTRAWAPPVHMHIEGMGENFIKSMIQFLIIIDTVQFTLIMYACKYWYFAQIMTWYYFFHMWYCWTPRSAFGFWSLDFGFWYVSWEAEKSDSLKMLSHNDGGQNQEEHKAS